MYAEFERIFERYADVPIIARSTLGADARRATQAQLDRFSEAFKSYLARKYGARFREFIGSTIMVKEARPIKNYYEVASVVNLRGQPPFSVLFRVSDRSGRDLFFDIVIEGISLGKTERTEIGAMLDKRRGDLDKLIADLAHVG
jgi:phospholipid transport system substrate-binding protein